MKNLFNNKTAKVAGATLLAGLLFLIMFLAVPTIFNGGVARGAYCTDCRDLKIDILPGLWPNAIDLKSTGTVTVAVYTLGDCEVCIDPLTVRFCGATPTSWTLRDLDKNGKVDLVLYFNIQDLKGLNKITTQAALVARTCPGRDCEGWDTVNIAE